MKATDNEAEQRARQLTKLKALLVKYKKVKTSQTALLQLSELASTVTEMSAFYNALESVLKTLFVADNFYLVLTNQKQHLHTAYCDNPREVDFFNELERNHWHKSLTELVYLQASPLQCDSQQRLALVEQGKVMAFPSICVDWLGVPLKRGNQVIGVIALQTYQIAKTFTDIDKELLQFIADYIVIAIDRVHSRELLEKNIFARTKKLTQTNRKLQKEIAERQKAEKMHRALLSISEITAADQSLDKFYDQLHQEIISLFNAGYIYICQRDNEENYFTFPAYSHSNNIDVSCARFAKVFAQKILDTDKTLLLNGFEVKTLANGILVHQDIYFNDQLKGKRQSWLGTPLQVQEKTLGVLVIQHQDESTIFDKIDLELIQFVSRHIGIAMTRMNAQEKVQQENEQLEKLVNERTKALQESNELLKRQMQERRKIEDQLYFDAHHDTLTKLPNRAMFRDRLSQAVKHVKRHPEHKSAVLFIDLDRFKIINDTLGHHVGDLFLIEIAERLTNCIRENDILARLGGDEFVILLDSFNTTADIEEVSSRILSAVSTKFNLEGHELHSNASIGIAICDSHYQEANSILRDADSAMYQAKNLGRGRFVFYDESMREQLMASMTLEQELRNAIEQKHFELHYQNITDLEAISTKGFEALLRWNHPKKGLLMPCDFLAVAEETGMIMTIESWVISEVAQQLKRWQLTSELKEAYISINLSGSHLLKSHCLHQLIQNINTYEIDTSRLVLEFNEAFFYQNLSLSLKGLEKLKNLGVRLALDNYGSDCSALNLLHDFPFHYIKLDRSFVKNLDKDDNNLLLIQSLTKLGKQYGYQLVAEGIESQKILDKLMDSGCEYGQGYFIKRPGKVAEQVPQQKNLSLILS